MKFQPGQSGNPAGRPLGSCNKKTIAMEEHFVERAQRAVDRILFLAEGGHPVAMRICAERAMPTGTNRALEFELPQVDCADDAQKALDMVIEAFGRGAITVREFPIMLGAVDRMARVAERIQQNRAAEHERYSAQRVHGVHPSMIPKPTREQVGRYEELMAKIERGEDPFPDDPVKTAYVISGEALYSPVNSDAAPATEETPAGAEPGAPADDALYSPVNSDAEAGLPAGAVEGEAISGCDADAASEPLAPSLPGERSERGEGGSPERSEGETGGGVATK
jgi:Family of unknown function (DUF5681)